MVSSTMPYDKIKKWTKTMSIDSVALNVSLIALSITPRKLRSVNLFSFIHCPHNCKRKIYKITATYPTIDLEIMNHFRCMLVCCVCQIEITAESKRDDERQLCMRRVMRSFQCNVPLRFI